MPYVFKYMEEVFKNLGFHLKLNNYCLSNLVWLKKKIEKKILAIGLSNVSVWGEVCFVNFRSPKHSRFFAFSSQNPEMDFKCNSKVLFLFLVGRGKKDNYLDLKEGRMGDEEHFLVRSSSSSKTIMDKLI